MRWLLLGHCEKGKLLGYFNAVHEIPNRKMKQSVKDEEGALVFFFQD